MKRLVDLRYLVNLSASTYALQQLFARFTPLYLINWSVFTQIWQCFAIIVASPNFAQTANVVGNKQFINSMIPHHSAAITMCEKADITDQELTDLCVQIIEAQQKEINQMNNIINRLNQ
jgi:hypothetical protein